jgi:proteasome activator subunit 3 (PA28 gamma)
MLILLNMAYLFPVSCVGVDAVFVGSHVVEQPASKKWKYDNCVDSESEVPGTKVMALPTGTVPCNKHLCDVVAVVKPHIRQLIEDANLVSL